MNAIEMGPHWVDGASHYVCYSQDTSLLIDLLFSGWSFLCSRQEAFPQWRLLNTTVLISLASLGWLTPPWEDALIRTTNTAISEAILSFVLSEPSRVSSTTPHIMSAQSSCISKKLPQLVRLAFNVIAHHTNKRPDSAPQTSLS